MAFVRKEFHVRASPDAVWDAVRDVGAIHHRLVRGFVVDTQLEGDIRVVTFANGAVVRERIVDIDDEQRRLVYSAVGARLTYDNASLQVFAEADGTTRLVWQRDLLPKEAAGPVGGMMDEGARAMQQTLERR